MGDRNNDSWGEVQQTTFQVKQAKGKIWRGTWKDGWAWERTERKVWRDEQICEQGTWEVRSEGWEERCET